MINDVICLRSDPCSIVAPHPTVVQMVPSAGPCIKSLPAVASDGKQIGRTYLLNLTGEDNFINPISFFNFFLS